MGLLLGNTQQLGQWFPPGDRAQVIVLAHRLLDPAGTIRLNLDRLADTLPVERACAAAALLSRMPDRSETAVRLFRGAMAREGRGAGPGECFRISAAFALMFRGHLREAARLADVPQHWLATTLLESLSLFGMISRDSARAGFRALLGRAPRTLASSAYAWWAADRDTAPIREYIGHYENRSATTRGAYSAMVRASTLSGHGYLALARGDTAGAIRQLQAIPDSLQLCWFYGRLTLAQLLNATGRFVEAARVLERRWAGTSRCGHPVADLLWTLERARAFEQVGRRAEARENYAFLAAAWQAPDPELEPIAREARSGAARLGK